MPQSTSPSALPCELTTIQNASSPFPFSHPQLVTHIQFHSHTPNHFSSNFTFPFSCLILISLPISSQRSFLSSFMTPGSLNWGTPICAPPPLYVPSVLPATNEMCVQRWCIVVHVPVHYLGTFYILHIQYIVLPIHCITANICVLILLPPLLLLTV